MVNAICFETNTQKSEMQKLKGADQLQSSAPSEEVSDVKSKTELPLEKQVSQPRMDTFTHEKPSESAGIYSIVKDENGNPKISVDGNVGQTEKKESTRPTTTSETEAFSLTEETTSSDITEYTDAEIKEMEDAITLMEKKIADNADNTQKQNYYKTQLTNLENELSSALYG